MRRRRPAAAADADAAEIERIVMEQYHRAILQMMARGEHISQRLLRGFQPPPPAAAAAAPAPPPVALPPPPVIAASKLPGRAAGIYAAPAPPAPPAQPAPPAPPLRYLLGFPVFPRGPALAPPPKRARHRRRNGGRGERGALFVAYVTTPEGRVDLGVFRTRNEGWEACWEQLWDEAKYAACLEPHEVEQLNDYAASTAESEDFEEKATTLAEMLTQCAWPDTDGPITYAATVRQTALGGRRHGDTDEGDEEEEEDSGSE